MRRLDGRDGRGRHITHFRILRILDNGQAAALFDSQETRHPVLVCPAEDDPDQAWTVGVCRAFEQHIHRWTGEMHPLVNGQRECEIILDEQMIIGRSKIYKPRADRFFLVRVLDGQRAAACVMDDRRSILKRMQVLCNNNGQWKLRGARRECRPHQSIEDAAQALGAVCIGPEVWAGLDRVPCADDEWLRELDSRLSWTPEPAASLEHDEPLAWTGLDLSEPEEGPCWRVRTPSKLWRARNRWRRWVYAWTAGAPPSSEPFVSLESDEGARTAYALARGLRGGWRSLLRRRPESAEFDIPAWLPRAEYRYLSLRGQRTAVRNGAWTVSLGRVAVSTEGLPGIA